MYSIGDNVVTVCIDRPMFWPYRFEGTIIATTSTGQAYRVQAKRKHLGLFPFKRWFSISDIEGVVIYRAPDGTPFA
jgi:hypothetical protein